MFLELPTLRNLLVSLYSFGADLVCMEFDYGLWGAYKLWQNETMILTAEHNEDT